MALRPAAGLALAAAGLCATGVAVRAAYPRPRLAIETLRHARRPGIDPDAVSEAAALLPDDPEAIRDHVLSHLVPFAHDWDVYGVPYYFPTLAEVLERGRGDCKSQALVLGSLLAAKGIPFSLLVSPDHVWADYAGKRCAPLEDPGLAVAEFSNGHWHARRPPRLALRTSLRVSAEAYWTAAPAGRRALVAVAVVSAAGVAATLPALLRRAARDAAA